MLNRRRWSSIIIINGTIAGGYLTDLVCGGGCLGGYRYFLVVW